MEKVLIYTDVEGKKKEVEAINQYLSNTNAVLDTFHNLQSFTLLDNPHAAISFLKTPVATFDGLILKASGIKGAVNPEAVASIFGIDRAAMVAAVASQPAINKEPYERERMQTYKWQDKFEDLLIYEGSSFVLDNEAVEKYLEKFSVFAETPAELEIFHYYENFCSVFNIHAKNMNFNLHVGKQQFTAGLQVEAVPNKPYFEIRPNKYLVSRQIVNGRKSGN